MLATILIYVIIVLVAANMLLAWIIHRKQARLVAGYEASTGTEDTDRSCKPRMDPDLTDR